MKKLLILMLVLGLASVSYGRNVSLDDFDLVLSGTTLSVVGRVTLSGSLTQAHVFDPDGGTDGYQYNTPATIEGSPTNAGSLTYIAVWNSGGWDGFDFDYGSTGVEDPPWPAQADTVWYTVQYSGSVGDWMDIWDYTVSDTERIGEMQIIPEPTTIALLGLGGLFLLRRRK